MIVGSIIRMRASVCQRSIYTRCPRNSNPADNLSRRYRRHFDIYCWRWFRWKWLWHNSEVLGKLGRNGGIFTDDMEMHLTIKSTGGYWNRGFIHRLWEPLAKRLPRFGKKLGLKTCHRLKDGWILLFKSIPIYGPYHAPHLDSWNDIGDIVGKVTSPLILAHSEHVSLLNVGSKEDGQNFETRLKTAVEQILLQPIRWNNILAELQDAIVTKSSEELRVVPFGTTADQLIYTSLKQTSLRSVGPSTLSQPSPSEDSFTSPKMPKLTIVGMSGRFPGAKDNEAF